MSFNKWALLSPCSLIFIFIFAAKICAADQKSITISLPINVTGDPVRANLFLIAPERTIAATSATVISSAAQDKVILVGRLAIPDSIQGKLQALFVLETKEGALFTASREIALPVIEPELLLDTAAIRKQIERQRDGATKMVGGEGVAAARELARARLGAIKASSTPVAFKKREAELNEQLNLLELRVREGGAAGGAAVSNELQEQLSLIESTRGEQIDLLQRELHQLQRERRG